MGSPVSGWYHRFAGSATVTNKQPVFALRAYMYFLTNCVSIVSRSSFPVLGFSPIFSSIVAWYRDSARNRMSVSLPSTVTPSWSTV